MTKPLAPYQIENASSAIRSVKSIDESIRNLCGRVESQADEWGSEVRSTLGRNIIGQFTNAHLGKIVFCAVVNALLQRRAETVAEHGDIVAFCEPPCIEQHPPETQD